MDLYLCLGQNLLREISEMLLFVLRIFRVLQLTFMSHFGCIVAYVVRWWSTIHCFACLCQIFPSPFIEESIFMSFYVLASFVKY